MNNLETIIHRYMNKYMPFKTVCIASRDSAWVTPFLKSLMRSYSRIGQNKRDRFRDINRSISEVISEKRKSLLQAPAGAREWWEHVDSLSQRRCSSARVALDVQSLTERNDCFAELCCDSAYKQPTPAQVESGVSKFLRFQKDRYGTICST